MRVLIVSLLRPSATLSNFLCILCGKSSRPPVRLGLVTIP
jgi:hypothetical protein